MCACFLIIDTQHRRQPNKDREQDGSDKVKRIIRIVYRLFPTVIVESGWRWRGGGEEEVRVKGREGGGGSVCSQRILQHQA